MKKISNLDRLVSAIEKFDFDFSNEQKTTSYKRQNTIKDSVNTKILSYASELKSKESKFLTKSTLDQEKEDKVNWELNFAKLMQGLRLGNSSKKPTSDPVDSSGLATGVQERTSPTPSQSSPPRARSEPISRPSIITPKFITADDIRADAARHGYTLEEAAAARDRYASMPKMPDRDEDIDPHTGSPWHPGTQGFNDIISRSKRNDPDADRELIRWMANHRAHRIESRIRANLPPSEIQLFDNNMGQANFFKDVKWAKSLTAKNKMFRLLKSVAKIEAKFLHNYI